MIKWAIQQYLQVGHSGNIDAPYCWCACFVCQELQWKVFGHLHNVGASVLLYQLWTGVSNEQFYDEQRGFQNYHYRM